VARQPEHVLRTLKPMGAQFCNHCWRKFYSARLAALGQFETKAGIGFAPGFLLTSVNLLLTTNRQHQHKARGRRGLWLEGDK